MEKAIELLRKTFDALCMLKGEIGDFEEDDLELEIEKFLNENETRNV